MLHEMKKIEITNTKDEVAEIIKKEIISGKISSDDNITQNFLAEKFGLSRMPIREALNVLVQEGFLEKKSNKKIHVVNFDDNTIETYVKILTSVEVDLIELVNSNPDNKIIFDVLLSEYNAVSLKEKILLFHNFISECQNDSHIKTIHRNLINGIFMYCFNYTKFDVDKVYNNIDRIIHSILETSFSRTEIHEMLLDSNNLIMKNIFTKDNA
ncbi:GntR family transcriptional regulator [Vibrio diazotrophicus]|jgi:DNA-binding transcriptional regulator YhcF (GntR family)|nr:GntR family transcriptional regulator [Vibrio diazotrophicus]